ncbi:MAG: polysaccharide deacetylase family protein [Clostridia bacterium]|nr:polysaccharide deacetylase family protein [Clostridia bacterium]
MKYLSLAFDDGPSRLMCEMADKIAAYGWHAAFAVIGRKITEETLPMLQYVIDNGFQLVSHGQQHVHIEKLSSRAEMIEELARPIHTVEENLHYTITMARLPFLSQSDEVLEVAKELCLPLLGQGIDGGSDWSDKVSAESVADAVLGSVCDGAIGCLHVLEHTCKALDTILPKLKEEGYCLVTPEELFLKKGITPPLGVQIHNVNDFLR